MSPKGVVNKIKNHAEKCKSISNMHKRNLIQEKLNNLIDYFKTFKFPFVNGIILFYTKILYFSIDKYLPMLREYSITKYVFMYGEKFHVDYVNDLLEDFNFIETIFVNDYEIFKDYFDSIKIDK